VQKTRKKHPSTPLFRVRAGAVGCPSCIFKQGNKTEKKAAKSLEVN